MAEPIDDGRPFEVGDLWRTSSFAGENEKADSLFDIQDRQLSSFDLTNNDEEAHFVFGNEDLGLSGLSPLTLPNLETLDFHLNQPVNAKATTVGESIDEEQSIWDGDFSLPDAPRLCTWESFDKGKQTGPQKIALLSEAGPLAFDAAVHAFDKSRGNDGVVPPDAALRALCNLCLGRPSVFFHWDELKERFVPVLDDVSVSGLSKICSESMMADAIEFGTLVVKLRQFAGARFAQNACPSTLALRSGVASILSAAVEAVSTRIPSISSWLRLQDMIARPRRLLQAIWVMVSLSEGLSTDIAVISAFANHVHAATLVDDSFSSVWNTLLARVSSPWLEKLAADLGLDDAGAFVNTSDESVEVHDSPTELRSPSYRRKMERQQPSFIRPEDSELISNTRKTLKLLHESVPDHPLVTRAAWGIKCPTECFYEHFMDQSTIAKRTRAYEMRVINAMTKGKPQESFDLDRISAHPMERDIYSQIYVNEGAQEVYLSDLVTRMSSFPDENALSRFDGLYDAASTALQEDHGQSLCGQYSWASRTCFNVLDRAVPLVKAQYRLANSALMRHLFRECNLRQHLELQRSFHLLQDGDFVDRLSTALFSAEAQSAERKRGTPHTGQKIGLRLGVDGEQRWPPASSELQLTLMGILNEASRPRAQALNTPKQDEQLPGDLSFAIRELSEDEIERVLDPNSTHALDFLRLQYTAPAPLETVFTPGILQKYDDIFRFLLVLLRLIHVATSCRIQVTLARPKPAGEGPRAGASATMFVIEAHHFVSVMMSFVMDVGINASWRYFSRSLEILEMGLRREDEAGEIMTRATMSVDGLRDLHDECLERIRGCLFLRRKQEKARAAVTNVMSTILKCATKLPNTEGDVDGFEAEYAGFRGAMTALHTLLQEKVDRPSSSFSNASDTNSESDAYRMLLLQLKWRDYL